MIEPNVKFIIIISHKLPIKKHLQGNEYYVNIILRQVEKEVNDKK